ncbi:LOW QUALITY PROTEIN: uncharacterized protein LOC143209278 [Lasioglossum baleicum]|uniref:LOW QUALITY PROTEIN: uncharacterized protein LOC143209278 n=1 Tax=Lasioglossum baleicum TaxID=434251 RepID=UPI003FCD3B3A
MLRIVCHVAMEMYTGLLPIRSSLRETILGSGSLGKSAVGELSRVILAYRVRSRRVRSPGPFEARSSKRESRKVARSRGASAQRSRPRRNATAARINRSRDPGEFIRFVAASLKAARVSFASRSPRHRGQQRTEENQGGEDRADVKVENQPGYLSLVGGINRETPRLSDESRQRLDNGESHLDKKRGRAIENIRIRRRARGPH